MSERITVNCFTTKLPRKPGGVGKVRIAKEASRSSRARRGDGLPDAHVPSARIERMISQRETFQPNRRGWARFYRWQDWFGRRLDQQMKLRDLSEPTAAGAPVRGER